MVARVFSRLCRGFASSTWLLGGCLLAQIKSAHLQGSIILLYRNGLDFYFGVSVWVFLTVNEKMFNE